MESLNELVELQHEGYKMVFEYLEKLYNSRAEVALQPAEGLDGMLKKENMHREMNMLGLVSGIPNQLREECKEKLTRLQTKLEKEDESTSKNEQRSAP